MEIGNTTRLYLAKEGDMSYMELYSPILNTNYYCQSNRLENLSSTEKVEIIIIKKQGLFSISFNRK